MTKLMKLLREGRLNVFRQKEWRGQRLMVGWRVAL